MPSTNPTTPSPHGTRSRGKAGSRSTVQRKDQAAKDNYAKQQLAVKKAKKAAEGKKRKEEADKAKKEKEAKAAEAAAKREKEAEGAKAKLAGDKARKDKPQSNTNDLLSDLNNPKGSIDEEEDKDGETKEGLNLGKNGGTITGSGLPPRNAQGAVTPQALQQGANRTRRARSYVDQHVGQLRKKKRRLEPCRHMITYISGR